MVTFTGSRLRLLLLEDDGAVSEFVFYAADVLLDSEDTSAEGLISI